MKPKQYLNHKQIDLFIKWYKKQHGLKKITPVAALLFLVLVLPMGIWATLHETSSRSDASEFNWRTMRWSGRTCRTTGYNLKPCPSGYTCVTKSNRIGKDSAVCVPDEIGLPLPSARPRASATPTPTMVTTPECKRTGCNNHLCVSGNFGDTTSTCEFNKDRYICLEYAVCERQANGRCGFTFTPKYFSCMHTFAASPSPTATAIPNSPCGGPKDIQCPAGYQCFADKTSTAHMGVCKPFTVKTDYHTPTIGEE